MRMTLEDLFDAARHGETTEQYKKRIARIRRLSNEQFDLEDCIAVLEGDPEHAERLAKKKARLVKVKTMLEGLQ